jgi:hypothetical protein
MQRLSNIIRENGNDEYSEFDLRLSGRRYEKSWRYLPRERVRLDIFESSIKSVQ